MGECPDTLRAIRDQLLWARSARVRPWPDRYVLLELVLMAEGAAEVRCRPFVISAMTGVPHGQVIRALDRLTNHGLLCRISGERDDALVRLGAPLPRTLVDGENAYERTGGGM